VALHRLAGVGVVVVEPPRGARVAPVSSADAAELYELRLALDPLALRRSLEASRADGTEKVHRAEIRAAHRALREASDPVEGIEAHRAFHDALLARCPSQRLLALCRELGDHALRYQVLGGAPASRGSDPRAEHGRLVRFCIAGRVDDAVAELEAHLRHTLDAVRALLGAEAGTTGTTGADAAG
jgi:GntR family transcriptional regulator, carbon starvation induced regulator